MGKSSEGGRDAALNGTPTPTAVLDKDLARLIRRTALGQQVMIIAVVGAVLIAAATAGYVFERQETFTPRTAAVVRQVEVPLLAKIAASCDFYFDLGTVPVAASPPPSRLGVKLLVDSRNTFHNTGCTGYLPPPSAELVKEATKFGIPVRY